MQSRRHSALEATIGTAVGFVVSLGVTWAVFPWFGWSVSPAKNLGITAVFTVVSVVRSYAVRRAFNYWGRR
jgi:hypothetical protein